MEMKKANSSNFYYSISKWVVKQVRQLTTSTIHLTQELLMNVQCSDGSRSFAKHMRALNVRSIVASHRKSTMTNWEQSLKLILLQQSKKLLKNSVLTILWSFGIWSKLERWKSLISGCFMSWSEILKKSLEVSSYSVQQQQTISWLDCDM